MYECPLCAQDPTSHSFREVSPGVFYTKPAEASRYWDRESIVAHYDGMLSKHKGSWTWIFDAEGFSLRHLIEVDVAIGVAKLVMKYSETLEQIQVVNSSWIVGVALHIVRPFLGSSVIQRIK